MSLMAQVFRDAKGDLTVYMKGEFNNDTTQSIGYELQSLLTSNPQAHVTVDLSNIDLVGASGIAHFVDTIKHLNRSRADHRKIQVTNIMEEFIPVFKLYTTEEAELFWHHYEMDSDETQDMGLMAARTRTFEN
jgi:anti-anti-sigma regulatory factor